MRKLDSAPPGRSAWQARFLRNWQAMLTISRVHELALPDWLQAGLLHGLAYLIAPDLQAAIGKRRNQTAAAVTLATAHECCTQMHASFAKVGATARRLAS